MCAGSCYRLGFMLSCLGGLQIQHRNVDHDVDHYDDDDNDDDDIAGLQIPDWSVEHYDDCDEYTIVDMQELVFV